MKVFGNSILFQEKKYNFQSVLEKTTILNVQSSKYSTYFYINYEIVHMILLKIKRGRSCENYSCLFDIEISYLLLNLLKGI